MPKLLYREVMSIEWDEEVLKLAREAAKQKNAIDKLTDAEKDAWAERLAKDVADAND